jgi:hypothetical protein
VRWRFWRNRKRKRNNSAYKRLEKQINRKKEDLREKHRNITNKKAIFIIERRLEKIKM